MTTFDRDYYENGLETGKSSYTNYRWMPEYTIPMAVAIIDYLGIARGQSVLEFGSAKGYLVKALRMLGRKAFGFDVSGYAVAHTDESVKPFNTLIKQPKDIVGTYDFCVAKDVLEHIPVRTLPGYMKALKAKTIFVCVPLGEAGVYRAKVNNLDPSHVVCEDEFWWHDFFETIGLVVERVAFNVPGIKEAYYKTSPKGHGFFVLNGEGNL